MSAQGGYDDLSAPHLSDQESGDDIEQILMEMVDDGELELVWLEDQQEFGFFKPETTEPERIPAKGVHAAPRSNRRANLRRVTVMTMAAFASPLIVGTACATALKGKPSLPLILTDPGGDSATSQAAPPPAPAPVTPTQVPGKAKTVPVKAKAKPNKAAPRPTTPLTPPIAPARAPIPTYERYWELREHEEHGEHRHHRHRNWNWDGQDAGRELLKGVRHHLDLPEPREAAPAAPVHPVTLPHTVQEVTQHVIHPPISPRDALHHLVKRQVAAQITAQETRIPSIASGLIDKTGNPSPVLAASTVTPPISEGL